MIAELVETSRLWGRTAARIDPRWVEPLAGHLLKRTYEEPRWERKRAQVVATERVTLYGLPIVAGRDRRLRADRRRRCSRDLFIRRALVEGEWDTRHHFFAENQQLVEEVEALEERARRRDILVDDQTLYDFYAARVPETVVSGAPLRPLVARRAPRAAGPADVHARAADQPGRGRGRRGPAGHLAPGRDGAAAQLPLRARHARTTA